MADKNYNTIAMTVKKLAARGAPEDLIMEYLDHQGVTPAELTVGIKEPWRLKQGFSDAVVRGATFGLSDKAEAGADALIAKTPDYFKTALNEVSDFFGAGKPYELDPNRPRLGSIYQDRLALSDAAAQAYEERNPTMATVGETLGAVGGIRPTPASATAPLAVTQRNLLKNILQGTAIGTGAGAVGGFGASRQDDPTMDVAKGAVMGGAIGAAIPALGEILKKGASTIGRGLSLPMAAEASAASRLGKALRIDAEAGLPGPSDIINRMRSAEVPMNLAAAAGEQGAVQRLGGQVIRSEFGGPTFRAALKEIDQSAQTSLLDVIDKRLSSGGDAWTTVQDLAALRSKQTKPLADAAFAEPAPTSERLSQYLNDPAIRRLLPAALERQRLDALNQGLPFNPNDYSITVRPPANAEEAARRQFDPSLGVEITAHPNLRTLDLIRRALREPVDRYFAQNPGARMTDDIRVQSNAAKEFTAELDRLTAQSNPAYKAFREAWRGPSELMDAVRYGQDFMSRRPQQSAEWFAKASIEERRMAQLGLADTLREGILRTGQGGNEALRIMGNQAKLDRMRPLFNNDSEFQRFLRGAMDVNSNFQFKNWAGGNSATAERAAADAMGSRAGMVGDAVAMTAGLASGNPYLGAMGTIRLTDRLNSLMAGMSPKEQKVLAAYLKETNPDLAMRVIQRAIDRTAKNRTTAPLVAIAGQEAGRSAPMLDFSRYSQ